MQSNDSSQLDLPALVQTVFLAIQQLAQRQDRTQQQLDQFQQETKVRQEAIDRQIEANTVGLSNLYAALDRQREATDRQFAANAEIIAANTAGLVELRNLVADVVRRQR